MKSKISPSIMCVDFFSLGDTLSVFRNNGIEYIHVDIMDGAFVPNYTLGTDFIKQLKKHTDIPLDIHLMINNPENKLDWFDFGKNDIVSVHLESTPHICRAINAIKAKGAKPVVAINPGTPLESIKWVLDDIDAVLIMAVNPGFAGQKMITQVINKIAEMRTYLDKNGYENIEIEVDGNVSFENARLMRKAGANIFVAGTSAVFNSDFSLNDGIKMLRDAII